MRYGSLLALGAAVAGLGLAPHIQAATITQDPATNYMAFEAETNVTLASPSTASLVNTADVGASGGAALLASGVRDDANKATAVYSLQFANAGTYLLYYGVRSDATLAAADQFAANSFFVPTAFNAVPATNAASNSAVASITYAAYVEPAAFTVAAGELASFTIASRETGTYIDRFAFVNSTAPLWDGTATADQRNAAFNALVNSPVPEPTSLAALALTAGMLLRPRRS